MGKGWKHGPPKGKGRGGPASGIPAQGGGDRPAEPFTADSPTRENAAEWNHDAETQAFRAEQHRLSIKRKRDAWAATDALVADKTHPAHWAAVKDTKDRLEGVPKQSVDLHAHVVAARAADSDLLAIALAGGSAFAAPPDDQGEPGSVVH